MAEQVTKIAHIVDGKVIDVKRAVPKNSSYSDVVNGDESYITNKIFIGGLPLGATEHDVRLVFAKYGKIVDLCIVQDKATRVSRGFGFVQFSVGLG